jgi:hypothetical protein
MQIKTLLTILFVCIVSSLLSGCGNSCGCDGATKYSIEIDGKILRAGSTGTKLVTKQEREHLINQHRELDQEFAKNRNPEQRNMYESLEKSLYNHKCSRLKCEESGISLYRYNGELLFQHKGDYTLHTE